MKQRVLKLIAVLFIASSILVSTSFAFPLAVSAKKDTTTQIAAGATIIREAGGQPRAWASSWHLGKCTSQTQKDWIVTFKFKTAKTQWAKATASQVKFYALPSSLIMWYPGLNTAYIKAANAGGITLCIPSGNGAIEADDIREMWVWLAS
jgi:hypothetical protein